MLLYSTKACRNLCSLPALQLYLYSSSQRFLSKEIDAQMNWCTTRELLQPIYYFTGSIKSALTSKGSLPHVTEQLNSPSQDKSTVNR